MPLALADVCHTDLGVALPHPAWGLAFRNVMLMHVLKRNCAFKLGNFREREVEKVLDIGLQTILRKGRGRIQGIKGFNTA